LSSLDFFARFTIYFNSSIHIFIITNVDYNNYHYYKFLLHFNGTKILAITLAGLLIQSSLDTMTHGWVKVRLVENGKTIT